MGMDAHDDLTFDRALRAFGAADPLPDGDALRLYEEVLFLVHTRAQDVSLDERTAARERAREEARSLLAERRG